MSETSSPLRSASSRALRWATWSSLALFFWSTRAEASEDWMLGDLCLDAGPAVVSHNLGQGLGIDRISARVALFDLDWRWFWGRDSGFTQGAPMRFDLSTGGTVSADGVELSASADGPAADAALWSLDFAYVLGWSFSTGEVLHRVTLGPWVGVPQHKISAPLAALGSPSDAPYSFGDLDSLYVNVFTDAWGLEGNYLILVGPVQVDLRAVYSLADALMQSEYGAVWLSSTAYRSGDPGNLRLDGYHYTRLTGVVQFELVHGLWGLARMEWSRQSSKRIDPASLAGNGVAVEIDTGHGLRASALSLGLGVALRFNGPELYKEHML